MIRRTVIALLVVLAATACRRDPKSESGEQSTATSPGVDQTRADLDTPLAVVDGLTITVGDLQDQINQQSPYLRPRYKSVTKQKELLQTMIRFELLAKEATKRGFDRDRDVIRAMKQVMIQKLMEDEFENKLNPSSIPDSEVRDYYDKHPEEFNRSEQVRVSAIVLGDSTRAAQVAAEAKGDA
ncbi:MAG: hypothetical protein KJO07_19715, partial [Deltaproteobacteria bacterium]|nr:hypothetical protein [Deltaproteobacteria bacterium]